MVEGYVVTASALLLKLEIVEREAEIAEERVAEVLELAHGLVLEASVGRVAQRTQPRELTRRVGAARLYDEHRLQVDDRLGVALGLALRRRAPPATQDVAGTLEARALAGGGSDDEKREGGKTPL